MVRVWLPKLEIALIIFSLVVLSACNAPDEATGEGDPPSAAQSGEASEPAVSSDLDADAPQDAVVAPVETPAMGEPETAQTPATAIEAHFSMEDLEEKARELSATPFSPGDPLPDAARQLNYDQYRRIQRTPKAALWSDAQQDYRIEPDPRGYLFARQVKLNVIDTSGVHARPYSAEAFDFVDLPLTREIEKSLGFSGFRAMTPFNQAGKFDELISFRGASFFRALGAQNVYGASGRGLAIGTASKDGEEFPYFREFWIVRPRPGEGSLRVFALLDGESVTGAFQFDIEPGPNTRVAVKASLYPRRELTHIGIAPLTSMYHFSPHDTVKQRYDFRPAVHDSEGLAFQQQNGEWVWRPLTNPGELQVSVPAQQVPLGFGLMQRKRHFDEYEDIEAGYELRPSVWIQPGAGWETGELTLVEIPTSNEYNDNIVVFWRPSQKWAEGSEHRLSYTMHWSLRPPAIPDVTAVVDTRSGVLAGDSSKRVFIIDYEFADDTLPNDLVASVSASAGKVSNTVIKRHPTTGLTRLSFQLDPEDAQSSELRAVLTMGGKPVTETWLYRWRRP